MNRASEIIYFRDIMFREREMLQDKRGINSQVKA